MQLWDHKKQIVLALLGIILVSGAILATKLQSSQGEEVQIVTTSSLPTTTELIAEIAGAVVNPGVYKLQSNSRVEDLITLGGGFTQEADVDLIEKTINRASAIKDGQKIYIPKKGEEKVVNSQSEVLSANENVTQNATININNASQEELEKLWGIGPVIAKNIIEQRPYSDTIELLNKKIVKSNVYERIKSQISVY
jgi:competence protein ComEA